MIKSTSLMVGVCFACLSSPALAQVGGYVCRDSYRDVSYGGTLEDGGQVDGSITVVGSLDNPGSECTETKLELPDRDAAGLSGRLEQSLGAIAGLQQFRRSDSRSANPTSQGITMRGLGGNAASRTLIFIDDVPQADPFGGWVSWPGLDAVNLRGVRVRKGAGQASAGPGALAGMIELESVQKLRQYNDGDSLTLGHGSRNSIEVRGRYLQWLGQGNVSLSGSYARGDGFIPIIKSQRGLVDRQASYEQGGVVLRMVLPIGYATDLQFSLRGFTDKRDRGLDWSDNSNSGVDASLRLVKNWGDWRGSITAYTQIREFSSEFGAVSADRSTVTPTLDQFATPSTGHGLRVEVRPPLGDKTELRLGGEWRRTSGQTNENFTFVAGSPTRFRTAGGKTDSYGLFAEGTYLLADALTLSAGGRADWWDIGGGFRREVNIGGTVRSDDRFVDRSGSELTARFGAAYALSDEWHIKASTYTGWRLPTLNELYRPFRVGSDATAANEQLAPERVKGIEASLSFSGDGYSFGRAQKKRADLTLFYNRLDDAIANVTLGQGPSNFPGVGFVAFGGIYRQRQNLDAIVSKGIEFDGRIPVGRDFGLRLGYTYVDAKVRGQGTSLALNDLRPAQVPRHFVNLALDFGDDYGDFENWQAALNLRYIGSQFDDDANSRRLKSAITADAVIVHRLIRDVFIELRGENLFNARLETAISSSGIIERATPRTLWLGVRWNFD
jgi:vitamin B12 transporter